MKPSMSKFRIFPPAHVTWYILDYLLQRYPVKKRDIYFCLAKNSSKSLDAVVHAIQSSINYYLFGH